MKEWCTSSTSEEDVVYNRLTEVFPGKEIEKVVLERTTDGRIKSMRIDFVQNE